MPKIRFGLPNPIARALPAIPNTVDTSNHAELELERALSVSNARFNEAVKTNGTAVMLWRRTKEGHICTCQQKDTPIEDSRLPGTEEQWEERPVPQTIRVRGSRDLQTRTEHPHSDVLGIDFGIQDEDDNDTRKYDELEVDDANDNGQFLDQESLRSLLDNANTTTCGVCFGSGFTNGYALYGGQRIALASQTLESMSGFTIHDNRDEDGPLIYSGSEGGALVWKVEIPAFFMNSWVTARNNVAKADVDILINDQPLTLGLLESLKGQVVTVSAVAQHDDAAISHVELVFQFSDWPQTQMDNLQDDTTNDSAETIQTFEFPFSPNISDLRAKDAFYDFKYGKVWRITNVTKSELVSGSLMPWTVTAASRTAFDVLSLLKVSQYPSYALSYRNLEL